MSATTATKKAKAKDPATPAKRRTTGKATKAVKPPKVMIQEIPLDKLEASPENVRTGPAEGIEALADNIAAIGLLSSLTVKAVGQGGRYAVVAGERRRQALNLLHERK